MNQSRSSLISSRLILVLFVALLISLVFSFRAVNSIAAGLLVPATLLYNKYKTGRFFTSPKPGLLFYACTAFFLYTCLSLLFHPVTQDDWRQLLLKTTLVVVPFVICCSDFLATENWKILRVIYTLTVAAGAIYCLSVSAGNYFSTGDDSALFYHKLVSPLKHHAIYYSLLVFFAILSLLESAGPGKWVGSKAIHIIVTVFLVFFLLLLSSKLIISCFICYLLYMLFFVKTLFKISRSQKAIAAVIIIAGSGLILFTNNPVSRRFADLFKGQTVLADRESYQPGDYFNGLQFRLLQWKLVPEMLTKENAWIGGTGAGRSQSLLAKAYIEKNMYTGNAAANQYGYLLYNTHNALLETLLKYGIPGMLLFIGICAAMVQLALHKKSRALTVSVVLLLLYSFTEAVLETQFGILIFTFFPLFFSRK